MSVSCLSIIVVGLIICGIGVVIRFVNKEIGEGMASIGSSIAIIGVLGYIFAYCS